VETFNNLLNPNGLPYIEASAINGVGVVETLREVVRLTIPPVSKKVFEKEAEEEEEKEDVEKKEEPDKKKEIEFAFSRKVTPVTLKKIKIESKEDIDEEIEKLTKEFTEEPEN
jgi:hypothetical protein